MASFAQRLAELDRIQLRAPSPGFTHRVRPPGSKSLSNRALLLAAMSPGSTQLHGLLEADDIRHMLDCLRALGIELQAGPDEDELPSLRVEGQASNFGRSPESAPELYVGTAGTVARFLVAALAANGAAAKVDGSPRMRERPMATLLDALSERGANFAYPSAQAGAPAALPLVIAAGARIRGGTVTLARPTSSQFVSALAIAAVFADAPTRIVLEQGSPAMPYITMTLALMRDFGFAASFESEPQAGAHAQPAVICVEPAFADANSSSAGSTRDYRVEPDASSASYLLALAAIYKGEVSIPGLGNQSLQGDAAFYAVLERFGAIASQDEDTTTVRGTDTLRGVDVDLSDMPDMTLTAAVVAAHAVGTTRIRGVEILRHHECDRIAAGATELRKLGCTVQEHEDGLTIEPPSSLQGGVEIDTYDDHRMAMAFALAGDVVIRDPICAAKTFPTFFDELARFGMCTDEDEGHAQPQAAEAAETKAAPVYSRVRAQHMDAQGDGVGPLEGETLPGIAAHAPGLFIGEAASVQVVAHARKAKPPRAHVRVLSRLNDHPQRRVAPCHQHQSRQGKCTGCPLMELDEAAQVAAKRARVERALNCTLGPNDFVSAPEPWAYRRSVKRVVGGNRGALVLGSFVRGSHQIADMNGCEVDDPVIVAALEELVHEANALGIEAYRAANARRKQGSGDLRYVWAKSDGERVVLTLITGGSPSPAARKLPPRLGLASAVAWSVQDDSGNAVRGGAAKALRGDPWLTPTLLGQQLRVGPLGFMQPNPQVAELAYAALVSLPNGEPARGSLAFDLYAGAGATTASLRDAFDEVIPCESYPESARALGVEAQSAEDFLNAADPNRKVELLIANPPRGGMGAAAVQALRALAPPRVHMMSCNPDSLARDIERLSPDYRVLAVRAFDTLPQTAHVEMVAWLERVE